MKKFGLVLLVLCALVCISSVTFAASFTDTKDTPYEGVVERIAGLGIVNGVSDSIFAPYKSITRGEMAKIIVYVKGMQNYADTAKLTPTFTDTKSHWAKNYIQVAVGLGLLKGYEDETFRPDQEVTYAETIAIVLRSLGYVNVDETSGAAWYSNYVKRMYDINLHQGMPNISSYTAPAKRGDVAILWWNMLVSDRWAISSQSESAGLTYTYSKETQLEKLFPDYTYVKGTITSIKNGESGDTIAVRINGYWYNTFDEVPLSCLGAWGTGVYDKEAEVLYGFSIDDDLSNFELIAGPIFYLNEQGYKLSNARAQYAYGSKSSATFAILAVSQLDQRIFRSVLVDASDSVIFDSIKIEYDKKSNAKDKQVGRIYINGNNAEDEQFATTDAVIIVNGKKVAWNNIPKGAILTTLIKGSLYTYETGFIEGKIAKVGSLRELYIDLDKYLVTSDCVYSIKGETVGSSTKLKEYRFSSLTKAKLEELKSRTAKFYLNAASEIAKIEFSRYDSDNIEDKYENGGYKLLYVQKKTYPSDDSGVNLVGKTLDGKTVKYTVSDAQGNALNIGDFIVLEVNADDEIKNVQLISANKKLGDDVNVIYHTKEEYEDGDFGQYTMTDKTLIYSVAKEYKTNSTSEISNCNVTQVSSIEDLGDLSKYDFVLVCNEDNNIDVIYAEREVNKVAYQVARVVSLEKDPDAKTSGTGNAAYMLKAKVSIIDGGTETYKVLSGDCEEGELITFEVVNKDTMNIKERFKIELIGCDKDIVVESIDKKTKEIWAADSSKIDLKDTSYSVNGRIFDFVDYQFIMATVKKDTDSGKWKFTSAVFHDKEDITLKVGDRIVFDELNGIAVVYRGYTK